MEETAGNGPVLTEVDIGVKILDQNIFECNHLLYLSICGDYDV